MSVQITCIKKDGGYHENPHTAISILGWYEPSSGKYGRATRLEMYEFVKQGNMAYVLDSFGNKAYLITAQTPYGTKYVKTKSDYTRTDNLLSLVECIG